MSFLVLLLVAVLLWFKPLRQGMPGDLLGRWTAWVYRHSLNRSAWFALALLLLPLPFVAALIWWVEAVAYGAINLFLQSLILLCCVGRTDSLGSFTQGMERALERQDLAAASLVAEQDLNLTASTPTELLLSVRGRIAWEACHGLFVPAFWFVLLGPVAAVAYRLLWLASRQDGGLPGKIVHALEWVPARLMMLSFAVVGHYERTLQRLHELVLQWEISTDEFMTIAVNAAAGTEHDVLEAGSLAEARSLLHRAVLVWAVTIAFLVMLG